MVLKNVILTAVIAVILSVPTLAANIQRSELTAAMECNACKNKVEKALKNTNGVEKVNVDLKTQLVKVDYDKDVVSESQLISAINKADAKFDAHVATAADKKTTAATDKKCSGKCCKSDKAQCHKGKEGAACCKEKK